ncbi:MAG TPA: hypothetical protein VHU24_11825 [Solirubrobacterales bacterium]|nr:hypothetical protein [Solirubrobacterales bacterium]
MLFDLQTPRRRRVVRVVFGGLALVFAISFVFLGVGTGGGGFSFSDLFGGGSASSSTAFDDDIKTAEAQLVVNPNDPATLARLVQLHYSAANANTDSNGVPTSDGEQQLREAADTWNKYVKASKGNLQAAPAVYALNTFDLLARLDFSTARTDTSSTEALTDINSAVSDWKSAAQAQQTLIAKQPNKATSNSYATLAQYLYLAGDAQGGNRAAAQAKAVKGADAATIDSQLKSVQQLGQQLQAAIKQLTKQQQQTQGAAGGATGGATGGGNPLGGIGLGGGGTGGL